MEPGRDFAFERADIRRVEPGDRVDGRAIRIEAAIEVGNIFKLGTRYSEALGATYLDEDGRERPIWMGSYGIGPARIAAAAVEQNADEYGIAWPRPLAPFDVHLVGLGQPGSEERAHADRLYEEQRDMIQGAMVSRDGGSFTHPHDWAGFVLGGDPALPVRP